MNLSEVHELADAVLFAWYPGEEGGSAAADILFGNVSPSGRLPLTFPKSLDQLPPYEDYSMEGRTYRYMTEEPMYPFGYGLSYASFQYSDAQLSSDALKKDGVVELSCTLTNTSEVESDEIAQLYVRVESDKIKGPLFSLKGVQRVHLKPGQKSQVKFEITPEMLKLVNEKGDRVYVKGQAKIYVSGSLPGKRSEELGAPASQEITLRLK